MTKIYDVVLNAPFGSQQGRITFIINGESLTGVIDGTGFKSKFNNGRIHGNNFEFSGEIKILLAKLKYSAKGILNGNLLSASVDTKYGTFSVTGSLISQS
ncbi:hypothetical protein [Clostridium beijerinckii]|uniref:hypothetical protein n=1 Tax=Clostridium beijerinckii TaxID=1520 RepID=UPI00047CA2A4|nr:hypothetical protein [Clostridium beijerinckii]